MLTGKATPAPGKSKFEGATDEKIAALIAQVQHLEAQLGTYESDINEEVERRLNTKGGKGGQGYKGKSFRFQKCDSCERNKKFCTHCRSCGESGHKVAECPKNQ